MSDAFAPDTRGIDPAWLAQVPDDAQARLASAIPECRFVWNEDIAKFQVVHREPAVRQSFRDGYLRGWQTIATLDPPLDVDAALQMLRARQHFVDEKLRKMGYASMDEYLADADNVLARMSEEQLDAALDDYFGGPLAAVRDEDDVALRRFRREMDQTRRHSAHTRLVVPARPLPRLSPAQIASLPGAGGAS